MRITRWKPVWAVVVAVALAGCASAPEAEKKAAEEAISLAKGAGAETYAAADFKAAADALAQAQEQLTAKKYDLAKTGYVKVKELAEKAAKGVEAGKTALKAEVEQQLAEAEKRWQDIEAKATSVAANMTAEQKAAWEADVKSLMDTVQAVKAAAGSDPLSAKEKVGTVVAAMDKWQAELEKVPVVVAQKKPEPKKAEAKKPEAKKN